LSPDDGTVERKHEKQKGHNGQHSSVSPLVRAFRQSFFICLLALGLAGSFWILQLWGHRSDPLRAWIVLYMSWLVLAAFICLFYAIIAFGRNVAEAQAKRRQSPGTRPNNLDNGQKFVVLLYATIVLVGLVCLSTIAVNLPAPTGRVSVEDSEPSGSIK